MTPEDLVALARDFKTKRDRAESRLELDLYRREMADLVPELADALEAALPKWIPVSERLPEDIHDVWVTNSASPLWITIAFYNKDLARFASEDNTVYHRELVTHWMPIKRPPSVKVES